MRIIFVPDGGFDKNGGFIEIQEEGEPTGNEPIFERQSFLTLRMTCHSLRYVSGVSATRERSEEDAQGARRKSYRSIQAIGEIRESRYGQFSVGFLGSKRIHSTLDVLIHEHPDAESVFCAGVKGVDDIHDDHDESFFVEIRLASPRFEFLLNDLQASDATLHVSLGIDKFRGFYANWSPSIDEGRLIKFLDSKRDVENGEKIPDSFWDEYVSKADLADAENPSVDISVVRNL